VRNRKRKRQRRKIAVPVASMGDIAFLLIIFFMVVSNFFKTPKIDADMPGWKP